MKPLKLIIIGTIAFSLSACVIGSTKDNNDRGFGRNHSHTHNGNTNIDPGFSRSTNSGKNTIDPGYNHQTGQSLRPGETIYSHGQNTNRDPGFSR